MKIFCLHGFFGKPQDWHPLQLESHLTGNISYPDLFANPTGILPFWDWASLFNETVPHSSLLIGYSLGGRLALHAALQRPDLYKGVVIISAHCGLSSQQEKLQRLAKDRVWAKKIREEDWGSLLQSWNNQSLFQNDNYHFDRAEGDFCRETLACALEMWSLGMQDDLSKQLEKLSIPLLFVAGEKDVRYAHLAEKLSLCCSHSTKWIASDCGHRVPWQQPAQFINALITFNFLINSKKKVSV